MQHELLAEDIHIGELEHLYFLVQQPVGVQLLEAAEDVQVVAETVSSVVDIGDLV